METSDTFALAGAFGIIMALLEIIKVVVGKIRNGNGGKFHPYEESRINHKLGTICNLHKEANGHLSKLVAHCDVEDERHANIKETLGRIERNTENA